MLKECHDRVQMTSSNLAVCFLPSLFRITDFRQASSPSSSTRTTAAPAGSDPRARSTPGAANPGGSAATMDGYQLRYKSALTCLSTLIANADYLLAVRHAVVEFCVLFSSVGCSSGVSSRKYFLKREFQGFRGIVTTNWQKRTVGTLIF